MKKILRLHIGHPKTATSHLQAMLHLNEDWLRNKGIFVPSDFSKLSFHNFRSLTELSRVHSGNASYLYFAFCQPHVLKNCDVEAYWDGIFNAAEGQDIFLSSELLFYAPEALFLSIQDNCHRRGYDIHLIAYLQRQDKAVINGYIQNVRNHGYFKSVIEFIDDTRKLKYFNYKLVLDNINIALRPFRTDVRTFDPDFLYFGDVWRDLTSLDLSDLAEPPNIPHGTVNEGLNVIAVETLRAVNRLVSEKLIAEDKGRTSISRILGNPASTSNKGMTWRHFYQPEIEAKLTACFANENIELACSYFKDIPDISRYWSVFESSSEAMSLPIGTEEYSELIKELLVIN